jgi:hypothetical protein
LTKGTIAVVEYEEPCEVDTKYSLLIRRAPENLVVAALEILSPSNKGIGNRFHEENHLRKRSKFLEAGIQLMEIDALVRGHREVPGPLMDKLGEFARVAWTATYWDGLRKYRGWGWNEADPLPEIPWLIDRDIEVYVEATALRLHQELAARLPGYLVPKLVREVAGAPAKTPVVAPVRQ